VRPAAARRVPDDDVGVIGRHEFACIARRQDRSVDLVGANCARDGIKRRHRPHADAIDIDLLDAGNLVQLIVRGRPKSACGYGFVSDISERTQTFGKANVRDDKLAAS